MHYVIVGNGVCGMEAALALRRKDGEARITLVSDEHDHFYSRTALMYVFAGQMRLRDTEPYDRGLYERLRFERVRERVAELDAQGKSLRFEGGSALGYDRLLLAVGSRARPAPWAGAAGPGLHYFVTLRDLEGLDHEAKPGRRAVVVGGGLIGVEVAEILLARGLQVTFVVRENWYFPLALDEREALMVAEHLRAHGVDVRLGVNVDEMRRGPDGALAGVRLGDAPRTQAVLASGAAEVPCDLLVCAIGVVPNTGFLETSGLRLAKGGAIEVDDALRASAADVWAAGDCANVTWADGSRRPEQLWYTARDQGRVAAASMLEDGATYRRGTWYNSAKFFDLEYTTAGWVPVRLDWDNTPLDPGPDVSDWFQRSPGRFDSQRIVCKGGSGGTEESPQLDERGRIHSARANDRVIGFNMLGGRWNHEVLLDWIDSRRSLSFVLDRLAEAQFDEELSPRWRRQPAVAPP
jgi:NADPH-dependent 2,4-dienoyl-CoA reductase/sulfur reductase-like enzyme